jgi:hypothetical protein
MFAGIQHIGSSQAKRINCAVGDFATACECRVDGGLNAAGESGIDSFGINTGSETGRNKRVLEGDIFRGVMNRPLVGSMQ